MKKPRGDGLGSVSNLRRLGFGILELHFYRPQFVDDPPMSLNKETVGPETLPYPVAGSRPSGASNSHDQRQPEQRADAELGARHVVNDKESRKR